MKNKIKGHLMRKRKLERQFNSSTIILQRDIYEYN